MQLTKLTHAITYSGDRREITSVHGKRTVCRADRFIKSRLVVSTAKWNTFRGSLASARLIEFFSQQMAFGRTDKKLAYEMTCSLIFTMSLLAQ